MKPNNQVVWCSISAIERRINSLFFFNPSVTRENITKIVFLTWKIGRKTWIFSDIIAEKVISSLKKVISSLKKHEKSIFLRPIFHVKNTILVVYFHEFRSD